MFIRKVGFLPAIVVYTTRFIPNKYNAITKLMFVLIDPGSKDDKGLLQHELTHVRQFYRTFGFHPFLYLFSKKYKLKSEVEAYARQLQYEGTGIMLYANYLVTKYDFDLTIKEAKDLITQFLEKDKYSKNKQQI